MNALNEQLSTMNTAWKQQKYEKPPITNLVEKYIAPLENLKSNLYYIKKESNDNTKCRIPTEITDTLTSTNKILNSLHNTDLTAISKLMPIKQLMTESKKFIKENAKNNLNHPFDFAFWTPKNFYERTKLSFKHYNNEIYLTLKFPLYKKTILSKITPKPIKFKNHTLILNTNTTYIIQDTMEIIYFNNETISHFCFNLNNIKYCEKPPYINDECDLKYISYEKKGINKDCFTEIKNKNIITRFFQDLYFTIKSPMIIDIQCKEIEYSIRLDKPTILEDISNCNVTANKFKYISGSNNKCETYFTEATENNFTWNKKATSNKEKMTKLTFFTIILMCYLLAMAIILTYKRSTNTPPENIEIII